MNKLDSRQKFTQEHIQLIAADLLQLLDLTNRQGIYFALKDIHDIVDLTLTGKSISSPAKNFPGEVKKK